MNSSEGPNEGKRKILRISSIYIYSEAVRASLTLTALSDVNRSTEKKLGTFGRAIWKGFLSFY
jgi:hypothetical protein